ncbi:MAG: hypothetical protein K6T78_05900 [Alicyclobacillus sp.]|nr:hypothetical protein [Alicyclobacillus sp.]
MANEETGKGVWNGIHWRFIGLTVVVLAALQVAGQYLARYPVLESLPLAVLIVSYIVIPRVKERRLANALTGVIAMYVVGLILEAVFDWRSVQSALAQHAVWNLVELNVFPLLLGVLVAFAYLRLTEWSERKRAEAERKRRQEKGVPEPEQRPRVHSKKYAKKKKKNKRR